MNPNNELVDTFTENYTESMSSAPATNDGPEHLLEKIDAFLRMGWDSNAEECIEEFETKYGVDFAELVAETTMSPHIKDPRGE